MLPLRPLIGARPLRQEGRPPAARGFTLAEMMIAMSIGILILVVVSQSFLSGVFTQRFQSDLTRLQESSRFAFDLLTRSIRHAGFRNTYGVYAPTYTNARAQEFCSTTSAGAQLLALDNAAGFDPASATLAGSAATSLNGSDVLRVRAYGEDNPAANAADGSVIDCLGNPIRRDTLLEETLYVAADATSNNEPTLFCHSTRTESDGTVTDTAAPLIPGVERMQLLYGEDTDADGVVNRYISYGDVTNPDNVYSVMVSLIVRTPNPVAQALSERNPTISQFGANFTFANDNRARKEFTTTIAMRNFRQCP